MARARFPMFPSLIQCQFCFQDANYAYATRQGSFNENSCMQALAKILRARASEHTSNLRAIQAKAKICEHFQSAWDHSITLPVSAEMLAQFSMRMRYVRKFILNKTEKNMFTLCPLKYYIIVS